MKKTIKKGDTKVKNHDRIIGKYRDATHQDCNLNLTPTKKLYLIFHNLQKYDSHFIFQEVGKYNFQNMQYNKNRRKIYELYY